VLNERENKYNPLFSVKSKSDAHLLAKALIATADKEFLNSFWRKAERWLLSALILFVKEELPPDKQNLDSVKHMLHEIGPNAAAFDPPFLSLPEDHPARETYECLMKLPELLRLPKDHPVRKAYDEVSMLPDEFIRTLLYSAWITLDLYDKSLSSEDGQRLFRFLHRRANEEGHL
jgi:hypothetical protein